MSLFGFNGVLGSTNLGALVPGAISEDSPAALTASNVESDFTQIDNVTTAIAVNMPASLVVNIYTKTQETILPFQTGADTQDK